MKRSAGVCLLAALVLISVLPAYGGRDSASRLWVTKEVLAEYVEDRLNQLEGREELSEEEAVEREFILQNRQNLPELADFYGMKIEEEVPKRISTRKKPSATEIGEKTGMEISQPAPLSSDTVRLEGESRPIEATLIETTESEESPVGPARNEEMATGKMAEKVEGVIGEKDAVKDEGTIPPVETSSPHGKSEKAVIAQKAIQPPTQLTDTSHPKDTEVLKDFAAPSDLKDKSISTAHLSMDPDSFIQVEEGIAPPKPSSLIAADAEIRRFFAEYVARYTQRDKGGFLSLFSPKAVQNQRYGFDEVRMMYANFFDESEKLRIRLEDMKIDIYQNAVEVRGRYEINQVLKKRGKLEAWKGNIRWILVRENGALRIRYLDFRP
jgi:hypothetical protein